MKLFLTMPILALTLVLALLSQTATAEDLRPGSLLVYYAWPSLIFGEPGPVLPGVANRFGSYDHVVLGSGLENPSHPEHNFVVNLITDPALEITAVYGYVDVGVIAGGGNLSFAAIELSMERWQQMGVDGILLDNFGHDYGTVRLRQNTTVDYAHSLNLVVIANAWDPDDVFSEAVTAGNPGGLVTTLNPDDYYLYESFRRRLGQVEDEISWQIKANKLEQYRVAPGTRIFAVTTTETDSLDQYVEDEFFHVWFTALLYGYEAVGFGEYQFSASGSSNCFAPVYARPEVSPGNYFMGPVEHTGSIYWRLTTQGRIEIDIAQHTHVFLTDVASEDVVVRPMLELVGTWPNPANPGTSIHFTTAHEELISLRMFDLAGRKVRVLLDSCNMSGPQSVFWDGCDDQGRRLPGGSYFFLLDTKDEHVGGRVVLVP